MPPRSLIARCSFALLLLLPTLAPAASSDAPPGAPTPRIVPKPPHIAARAHLLMDAHTGAVLAGGSSRTRTEPASLTKLMTAYALFNELKNGNIALKNLATVSEKAWKAGGSRMFIEVNQKVSVEDLLRGIVVSSGNDASIALAEHVGGSEEGFVTLMNQYADRLGMRDTHFINSTGWPHKDHYSSAYDMALLAAATIRDFPEYYPFYAEKEFAFNRIKQRNRNTLLWRDAAVDGLKTGHTQSAGYCLVASADRDGMRLISVVLGAASDSARVRESQKLLEFGFRFYETRQLFNADEALVEASIWKGERRTLALGLAEGLYFTLGRNQFKSLKIETLPRARIEAPVRRGDPLGALVLSLDGRPLLERPLVALDDVAAGGLWTRLVDTVRLWMW